VIIYWFSCYGRGVLLGESDPGWVIIYRNNLACRICVSNGGSNQTNRATTPTGDVRLYAATRSSMTHIIAMVWCARRSTRLAITVPIYLHSQLGGPAVHAILPTARGCTLPDSSHDT
jgi:hypothetical protein